NLYAEPIAWVGYVQSSGMDITVDLGGVVEGICEFQTTHFLLKEWAINTISGITVSVSTNGDDYIKLGNMSMTDEAKDGNFYYLSLSLQEGVKASHIKFTLIGTSGWSFVSEVAAYSYAEAEDSTLYNIYPNSKMPEKIENEELWDASDADYSKSQNLLLNIIPQMFSAIPLEKRFLELNTEPESGLLTDGVYSPENNYANAAYFHMTRGVDRTLVFDLTKTSSISGYKLSFCHTQSAAVYLPTSITVFVSENGTDWYQIKRITDISSEDRTKCIVEGKFGNIWKARFVAISMPVHTHLYCDEIEIIGKKSIAGATSASGGTRAQVAINPDKYASPDKLSDVHDVILMYNARDISEYESEEQNKGLITIDESLSYVAYRDTDGKIIDYMADSYLYLPFGAFDHTTAEGWHKYVENTFTQGYNLDALNTAVGMANEVLGNSDYKVKVFLSVLRPNLKYDENDNLITFGDIDGDGKNEDFTKLEDRVKCLKWEVDENLCLFNEGNYENLELVGFYWYEEQVSYQDAHELDMIKFAVDYVHGIDYAVIWIPYYQASGFYDWYALGFDVACMQPNYFWKGFGNYIAENAIITKALGMCVEFEVDNAALGSSFFRKNYKAYLKGGIEYGYMKDTIHMYYISGGYGALYDSYLSKNKSDRSIYDDTYKFMKGTLEIETPKTPDEQTFECKMNKTLSGQSVQFDSNKSSLYLAYAPKYGSLILKNDGGFIYTPTKDFYGEDCFYVYADNDYLQSEIVKVTINVD
ncbi:MAG TPA: hypothetical protein DD733_00085, partial [Clostridiales bacterium]|nr:hypothetical protein [Clostridiales bacterium]